jgi:hypothetical protein
MTRLLSFSLLAAALAGTGCSHAMRITNLHEYQPAATSPLHPPRTVGLTSRNIWDPATRGFVDAIAEGLRRDASFQRVLYPFDARMQQEADVVLDVSITPQYSGRGSNFLVNFPGFLIFAPAIWGYGYEASVDTRVALWTREGAAQELAIPTKYQFRQSEIDRTWTEIGWLEVGIIPLIGGLAFTRYDPDVTPEFVAKVGPSYGAYVAQRVRESLLALPAAAPPPAPAAAPADEQAAAPVPTS